MSTLPIIFNSNDLNQDAIHARDLHQSLEVGKEFANWIKDRIQRYNLVENQDYILIADSGKKSFMGRPAKEYHLTVEVAKSIAMMENNQRGQEIRQYFINVETKAKQLLPQLRAQNLKLTEALLDSNPMFNKIVRYSQMGLNNKEVCLLCERTPSTVNLNRHKLAELGLIDRPTPIGDKRKITFSKQQLAEMMNRRLEGQSYREIAEQFDCSRHTIRTILLKQAKQVKHAS